MSQERRADDLEFDSGSCKALWGLRVARHAGRRDKTLDLFHSLQRITINQELIYNLTSLS